MGFPACRATLVLALGLAAACSPRPQDCAKPNVFCAGLVTEFGSVSEGIAREAWLALQDTKSAGLLDRIDRIETVDTRDRAANIKVLADAGYDVIVTVGASITEETVSAARQYPGIRFVGVEQPQDEQAANLTGLVFHEERSGFLAGALATMVAKTDRIAAVCEAKYIDPVRRYCEGFQAGARYTNPDVHATVAYRDGPRELLFHDDAWGSAAALQQLDQGADVVFAAGGETADAALVAAARGGAAVIGTETDLYERLPGVRRQLLTSALNDVRAGVVDLLQLARTGQLPSGQYFGQSRLGPFHEQGSLITADMNARIQVIFRGLLDGTIQLEIPYKSP